MKLLFLYYDIMNLYGETGNMRVLERHLRDQGLSVTVECKTIGDELDFSQYDFIYAGSGTERSQKAVLQHLLPYRESLANALEGGVPALFTGNACELLGDSITDGRGTRHEALGILPFHTTEQPDVRYTGDAVASCELVSAPIVGFVNKCSVLEGVQTPLFQLQMGCGNTPNSTEEGFQFHNTLGTHLIGPLLVKNPALMEWMVTTIGSRQEGFSYQVKHYEYEEKAYLTTYSALRERLPEKPGK